MLNQGKIKEIVKSSVNLKRSSTDVNSLLHGRKLRQYSRKLESRWRQMESELASYITFSLGVLGAGLGVLNYWRDSVKEKVRLKVIPKRVKATGGADSRINVGIEVINLSSFHLTIKETGFVMKGWGDKRLAIINPITAKGEVLPFRLEPRASLTTYAILKDEDAVLVKTAYASTACENEVRGNSPALKGYVKKVKNAFRENNY